MAGWLPEFSGVLIDYNASTLETIPDVVSIDLYGSFFLFFYEIL